MKLTLRDQMLVVNIAILCGIAYEWFKGAPLTAILIAAIVLLMLADTIFLVRMRRQKNQK